MNQNGETLMNVDTINKDTFLATRYRATRLLGSGGHADVYLAEQLNVGRQVALKLLKQKRNTPHAMELSKRFEQEARFISQLKDSHTITLYDFGETPSGQWFMAFEYIEGESLRALLKREGALKPQRVVTILRQVLLSLQEAHAYGMLHRDIKPDNIIIYNLLNRKDRVKVLDFGIAKLIDDDAGEDLTQTGNFVGTPRYTAPERLQGKPLTPSTDLYSLGLVAYQMLTGTKPYMGLKTVKTIQQIITPDNVTLPVDLNIPLALRDIIHKMLNKEPEGRYPVAEAILIDLETWNEPTIAASGQHAIMNAERIDERPEHAASTTNYPKTKAPATTRLDPIVAGQLLQQDKKRSRQHKIEKQAESQQTVEFQRPTRPEPEALVVSQIPSSTQAPQIEPDKPHKHHRQVTPSLLDDVPQEVHNLRANRALSEARTEQHQPVARTDRGSLHKETLGPGSFANQFPQQTQQPEKKGGISPVVIIISLLMVILALGLAAIGLKLFVFT